MLGCRIRKIEAQLFARQVAIARTKPIKKAVVTQDPELTAPPQSKATTHLALLLCADEEVHDLANSWLTAAGIRVLSAPTAQDAANWLLNEHFELLVLDELPIYSPRLPSLLELKEKMPYLRIILIPRFGQKPEVGIARISGVDAVLVRPLCKTKLLSVVGAFG